MERITVLIEVRLDLIGARRPTYSHELFWDGFRKLDGRDGPDEFPSEESGFWEEQLREEFAPTLQRLLNGPDSEEKASRRPGIEVRFRYLSYGSIKFILELLGVDNDVMKDGLLFALEAFAPLAFNDVLGSNVPLHSTVRNLTMGASMEKREFVTRMQSAMQVSLLVPVLLALGVLYVASNMLMKEHETLSAERSEFVKALISRNESFSNGIVEQAKSSIATAKAMEELQAALIKTRATALGLTTVDAKAIKDQDEAKEK
jgi:hypothetical protein